MKISLIFLAFILALLLPSCMSFEKAYVQKADYNNSRYENSELKRKNIVVTEVIDNRFPNSNYEQLNQMESENHANVNTNVKNRRSNRRISRDSRQRAKANKYSNIKNTVHLGLLENNLVVDYYYRFRDPLDRFGKKSLAKILQDSSADKQESKIPVKVEINDLQVYDEWGFWKYEAGVTCSLKFYYSDASGDKVIETRFEDSFSSQEFINGRVQYLVYDAIYDCAGQFIQEFDKSYPGNVVERDSSEITEIYDYKKAYNFESTFFYQSGTNLTTRAGYAWAFGKNNKDSWFQNRYGLKFAYNNYKYMNFDYQFLGLGIDYSPIIYFTKSHQGIFFNPEFELFWYQESSRSGNVGMDFSAFAANVYGKFGVNIGNFSIKAGMFAVKGLNSTYIDTGSGFIVEIGYYVH